MSNPLSYRARRAVSIALVGGLAVLITTSAATARPIVPRSVLKTFFETGDRPTQAQFAVLIDSSVNQYLFSAGAGGAHIIEGLDPGTGILLDSTGTNIKRFGIGDTVPQSPLFAQSVNLSSLVIEDRYILGLRFMQAGLPHFGYMEVSVDAPLPGQPGFFGLTVHYLAYEDQPGTPLTVVPAPGAFGMVLVGAIGLHVGRRRRAS